MYDILLLFLMCFWDGCFMKKRVLVLCCKLMKIIWFFCCWYNDDFDMMVLCISIVWREENEGRRKRMWKEMFMWFWNGILEFNCEMIWFGIVCRSYILILMCYEEGMVMRNWLEECMVMIVVFRIGWLFLLECED